MPNYTLVANSTFQPFTYQELMMPIERQNQYFEKLAEEYDKMSSQADVLEAMGSSDLDKGSNTYNRYKAYSDNLRKERDNLFANGLNFESRQRLSDLRRMYNTEIVPIQNAWQKREQEAQLQMKARMDAAARGIDIRFSRDAANSSLDSYMQNPNQTFQVINGQQITNEVANQFKGLASQVQSDGNGNYFIKGKPLSQIEYSIITQKGMDWNHYQDFINNPNDSRFANIRGIIENTLNAHGIKNFDENTYRDMFAYGAQGVAAGVGARDVQLHTDKAAEMALEDMYRQRAEERQLNKQIALEREKARLAAEAAGGGGDMPNIPSVAVGLTTTDQYRADNLEVLGTLKAGNDAFKRSYFGNTFGNVNPMKIYDEYQKELKKHTTKAVRITPEHPGGAVENVVDTHAAKKAILDKYKKYGVTDILSKKQYDALTSMGYSGEKNLENHKYSNLMQKFNQSVEQRSRYSTNMTDYDNVHNIIAPRVGLKNYSNGMIWALNDEGGLGKIESGKDLKLAPKGSSEGNKITDVQYDPRPEFKGKIIIQVTDKEGKSSLHAINPNLYDSNLANLIRDWENQGAPAQAITAGIYDFLNKRNKVQSKTDSKLE